MSTVQTLVAIAAGSVVLLGGLAAVARAIWRAAGDVHKLMTAVRDNTAATHTLSSEYRTSTDETTAKLADHETRIVSLERRP